MTGFAALLARDLRLVWRRPGDVMVVLAFFVVATVLLPDFRGFGQKIHFQCPRHADTW